MPVSSCWAGCSEWPRFLNLGSPWAGLAPRAPQCILQEIQNLFTFKDSGIQKVINKEWANFTFHFELDNGGLFYLYFANCEPNTPVSFDSRIEMYNEVRGKKDFLSVGETELETVYWVGRGGLRGVHSTWDSTPLDQAAHQAAYTTHSCATCLTIFFCKAWFVHSKGHPAMLHQRPNSTCTQPACDPPSHPHATAQPWPPARPCRSCLRSSPASLAPGSG